ncbi:MAG: hypothetical protein R3C59_19110 [Planctomycetaceae bacterium]
MVRLLRHELYLDTVFISDDAAAFRLLGFFHSLCWVHQERQITRLVPETTRQQRALDQTRDDIWKYYQRLKRYQKSPTPQREAAWNRTSTGCSEKTGWLARTRRSKRFTANVINCCWSWIDRRFRCTTICQRTTSGST